MEKDKKESWIKIAIATMLLMTLNSFMLLYGAMTGNGFAMNLSLLFLIVIATPLWVMLFIEELEKRGLLKAEDENGIEKEEEICSMCDLPTDMQHVHLDVEEERSYPKEEIAKCPTCGSDNYSEDAESQLYMCLDCSQEYYPGDPTIT